MLNNFSRPRRVVITGMGCATPVGIGRDAFWSALRSGVSGTRRIENFDVSDSAVKIAAEVRDFDWESHLNPKDRKHVPRTVPLALAAAREAFWLIVGGFPQWGRTPIPTMPRRGSRDPPAAVGRFPRVPCVTICMCVYETACD